MRAWPSGLLLLSLLGGCSERTQVLATPPASLDADETWRVVRRFTPERSSSFLTPTATIGDETRPVLAAIEPVTLNYAPAYAVPDDGWVRLRPPLPPELQVESVFLSVRVRMDDRWVPLAGQHATARRERGKLRVHVDFELSEAAGRKVGIWVQALPPPAELAHESARFEVPPRARLDFGIAVLEPAWQAGPVEFSLELCSEPVAGGCEPLHRMRVDPARESDRGFLDQRVGLQAFAGRSVFLRFRAQPLGGDGPSLPVWADPVLLAPEPRIADAHNVILLSLDTLRADHMGAYGYARDTTPFMDALALEGVLFERYLAAASSTRPSHMTMFTSLQPSVHGATENTGVRDLPTAATTLAELLRDAGVTTAAFTENGAIDRSRGFSRGFDVYFENRDSTRADLRTGHIEQTFSRALDWLAGLGERRFFLFLHTYQVHNPFTPPPGYERFWRGDPGPLAPPAGLRPDWDPLLYDREIRYTDDRVRALVEALREQELLDDTYFVLTSDHGEAFLEHGFVAHGASVHREVLGVPLIITGPGVPAGRRLVNPVPMVDLMPTILDLMNVAGSGLEMGRSQANPVRGMPEAAAPERAIYSEAWAERAYRARGFDLIEQPTTALQLGDWKIIRSRSQGRFVYELYDLSRDPRETNDRFGQYPEETANLLRLLDRYDERVKELHERLGGPIAGTAPGVDPDLEEKLRALGYLD